MNLPAISFLLPYCLSAIICIAIGAYTLRRRSLPGALAFAALALLEAEWTLGYILQSLTPSLDGKLFWNNVQFFGAVATPLAYYYFSFAYTGRPISHPRLSRALILGAAAAVLLLIWTNNLHGLFRIDPHLVPGSPFPTLVFANGPTFILYPMFGYSLVVIGTYFLAANYLSAPRIFRLQIGTILIGILIPWITTVVTWIELVPVNMHDVTPLTFGISNLVVAWAFFRYRLFDLVPVAHSILVENMEDGVIVVDQAARIIDMNAAAQAIFDYPAARAFGKSLYQVLPVFQNLLPKMPEPGRLLEASFEQHAWGISADKATDEKGETDLRGDGGEDAKRAYEVRASSFLDNRRLVTGSLILLRDITARKQTEEELHRLAITDSLTGLYNRRHFFTLADAEFERSVRGSRPLSMILIDVDHFKDVNDTYGHLVGDQVLATLAHRCRVSLRPYDVMARYGGEEFIILLPETASAQAEKIAERLRAIIADTPFYPQEPNIASWGEEPQPEAHNGCILVTISLGVATLQGKGESGFTPQKPAGSSKTGRSCDWLLERADQALYQAKRHNRNYVCVWGEMREKETP